MSCVPAARGVGSLIMKELVKGTSSPIPIVTPWSNVTSNGRVCGGRCVGVLANVTVSCGVSAVTFVRPAGTVMYKLTMKPAPAGGYGSQVKNEMPVPTVPTASVTVTFSSWSVRFTPLGPLGPDAPLGPLGPDGPDGPPLGPDGPLGPLGPLSAYA
jgi:hypothetical protein